MASPIFENLQNDVKTALKARDTERAGALRMLVSSIKNKQIDLRREVTDEDVIDVLATEAKKRREAFEAFQNAGREELAIKEAFELKVIEDFLPQQLTAEEVAQLVDEAIAATGAQSQKEMGKVMGRVVPQTKGRFDGSKLKDIVMSRLSQG